jgi:hypothetical protein
MALAFGEGGEQTAPLGRAVIGGLGLATLSTLLVIPAVFTIVRARAGSESVSLDPNDPESSRFETATTPGEGDDADWDLSATTTT